MSSSMNGQSNDQQNASLRVEDSDSKTQEAHEVVKEGRDEDEDEEEDLDFNPFVKGTPSPEASSSLSSELECLDGNSSKITPGEVQNYAVGDSEHGEEVVMQTAFASESEQGSLKSLDKQPKKKNSDSDSRTEREGVQENENGFSKSAVDLDDEDAIWKRTRARYSLASFTLDELETFLQETDDENDLHNVDDEEEYRKFLAAVLQGGDGDGQSAQDIENGDDEDEDNDADFEIELEELLESDVDDSKRDEDRKLDHERSGRRPETRQNRRQKTSAQYKKKLLEQSKRPLRPLLPIVPNGAAASFPTANGKAFMPEAARSSLPFAAEDLISGFAPQQIGQLHCLIHEHVQLLIQVFSLCILDPSKQQIASQVQGLIFEMLHKRDEVVACRNVPYPSVCFYPPYMCPSVVDDVSKFHPPCSKASSTPNIQMPVSKNIPLTNSKSDHLSNEQISSSESTSSFWVPFVSSPLLSILDVAPLNLVAIYMDDVFNAVREYRQRHLDASCDAWNEREPLFYLPHFPALAEANGGVSKGNAPPSICAVPSLPGQQPPKKTLAASIVENAKKQSVALVPKDISKLAERFLPLFNPAIFPHKPPPAAVANRVLFTDSEDELLALGMMEFNTDWKAIQQRFLPCKSKHQIFVRQKNRCSSKAPENPIKTVRRLKTSPLSAEEIECIQEGLRVFRHDWMSVWRYIVPHRDPSLLPRQWRIALGTQKSYKSDAAKKEKRRIYESNRRRCKTADLADWQQDNQADCAAGGNNRGDDYIDNANEAYVHQAFLADWRPDASSLISPISSRLNIREKNLPSTALPREQSQIDMHGFPCARLNQYPNAMSQFTYSRHFPYSMQQNSQVSDGASNTSKSHYSWPHRMCIEGAHLVKLAPDLPPVNLPPTVRVISQAAFKSNQCGVPIKLSSQGLSISDSGKENMVAQPQQVNLRNTSQAKTKDVESNQVTHNVVNSSPELTCLQPGESAAHGTCGTEERGTDSDLQMHPLLFQAPEDGCPSYYPLSSSSGASSSFTFFSANQPQLNLGLFHHSYRANQESSKTKEFTSASCGIDFHPLLQRTDEENSDFAVTFSSGHQLVSLGSKSTEFQNPLGAIPKSPVNAGPTATSSRSSGCFQKVNDLDLEIHLSSSSAKNKTRGSRDISATNQPNSRTRAQVSENTFENLKTSSSCHQHHESCPTVHSNIDSGADISAVSINNDSTCNVDDIGDQSHPEIVMEQEELSDSDEETEEHVEFECEEMADSDGEEALDCEPVAEMHDKVLQSFASEKNTSGADYDGKQFDQRSLTHPRTSSSMPGKGSPFLKLGLTSLRKDASNSSWLTLDPSMKPKYEECTISVSPVTKSSAVGRPNRTSKKITPSTKRSATENVVVDMSQQLSLGPMVVSTLKKPRKRVCRANTSLSTRMTAETSPYNQEKSN